MADGVSCSLLTLQCLHCCLRICSAFSVTLRRRYSTAAGTLRRHYSVVSWTLRRRHAWDRAVCCWSGRTRMRVMEPGCQHWRTHCLLRLHRHALGSRPNRGSPIHPPPRPLPPHASSRPPRHLVRRIRFPVGACASFDGSGTKLWPETKQKKMFFERILVD